VGFSIDHTNHRPGNQPAATTRNKSGPKAAGGRPQAGAKTARSRKKRRKETRRRKNTGRSAATGSAIRNPTPLPQADAAGIKKAKPRIGLLPKESAYGPSSKGVRPMNRLRRTSQGYATLPAAPLRVGVAMLDRRRVRA
jgi:hypothetical protein